MEMKFNQLDSTTGFSIVYENDDDVSLAVFDDETNEAMYVNLPIEDLALIAECINHILKKDAKK
jgi:hypothetical protein